MEKYSRERFVERGQRGRRRDYMNRRWVKEDRRGEKKREKEVAREGGKDGKQERVKVEKREGGRRGKREFTLV